MIDFGDIRCYRCRDKAGFKTPGPDPTDIGRRADAIRRQPETQPEVVIGDPKTGAAFALGPAPHVHGVWRRD